METKAKPDWSKIGRRCRRKGKKYECVVARLLRETTGHNWQSTRNSGRTDLKGDVYCLLLHPKCAVVECKDRKDFSPCDMIRGNRGYVDEITKVIKTFEDCKEGELVVFAKLPLVGHLVMTYPKDRLPIILPTSPGVVCVLGHEWYLLPDDADAEVINAIVFPY